MQDIQSLTFGGMIRQALDHAVEQGESFDTGSPAFILLLSQLRINTAQRVVIDVLVPLMSGVRKHVLGVLPRLHAIPGGNNLHREPDVEWFTLSPRNKNWAGCIMAAVAGVWMAPSDVAERGAERVMDAAQQQLDGTGYFQTLMPLPLVRN